MLIRYTDANKETIERVLDEHPLTIGRSPDADIVIEDEKASRMHCGIRLIDDEYYVKDLKSKNGVFLNNQRVESAPIHVGDIIRVCSKKFYVDDKASKGANTILQEVEDELSHGKGYTTMLKEIVSDSNTKPGGKTR